MMSSNLLNISVVGNHAVQGCNDPNPRPIFADDVSLLMISGRVPGIIAIFIFFGSGVVFIKVILMIIYMRLYKFLDRS